MQEQLSELEKQRQAEIDKKKTDDSKVLIMRIRLRR